MSIKFDYVAGFLFDKTLQSIVLIEKQKPDWQKGKLNAVGGKIEPHESADDAMRREFQEETGLDIPDWKRFCVLRGESESVWRVHFYYAIGDFSPVKQMEAERPLIVGIDAVNNSYIQMIPNLRWLVPMAHNFAKKLENCSAFQVVEVLHLPENGDAVEKDLAFIDFLNDAGKLDKESDEIVFDGLLSKDEFFQLSKTIRRNGVIDESEMERLTRWAGAILSRREILRLLMDGWVTIAHWDGDEPILAPTADTLEFISAFDFDAPMLEENRYAESVQAK